MVGLSGVRVNVVGMNQFDPARMFAFDLETTGRDPRTCRIVTSALIRISKAGAEPKELLADPGVEIPAEATAVHGISTEHARAHGRPHDDVLAETISDLRRAWADGFTVVAYNACYDLSVLRALEPSFTVDGLVLDPFVIDKNKDPRRKGRRTLTNVCEHYNVTLENAHEATADALAAARIAWKQARQWPELTEMTGPELMEFQAVAYFEMQTSLANYLRGRGKDPDDVETTWPMRG